MYLSRYDLAIHILEKGAVCTSDLRKAYRKAEPPFSVIEIPVIRDFGKDVVAPLGRALTDKLIYVARKDFPPMEMQKRVYVAKRRLLKPHLMTIPVGRMVEAAFTCNGYKITHRRITASGSMYYSVVDDKDDVYTVRLSDHPLNKPHPDYPIHAPLLLRKKGRIIGLGEFREYFQMAQEHTDPILAKLRSLLGLPETELTDTLAET